MTQSMRLPKEGRINRLKPIKFRFNGKSYSGFEGDTLASALLANGVRLVGRSFKYHRPRGIMGSGPEDPNSMVQVRSGNLSTPNQKATQIELFEGLEAASVSCWPSVGFDLASVADLFSPILPAGFYYKTFMYPRKAWLFYEKWIRKAAGFGVAESECDTDRYDKINAWCDVLIVGGGPSGLAAALSSARAGARVIVAEDRSEFGGGFLRANDANQNKWLDDVLSELREYPEVRLFVRSTVVGYYDSNFLVMNERLTDHLSDKPFARARERIWRIRATQVILATGAIERPFVFGNNDLPGIMLASAVSEYIYRFRVKPGRHAVVFTNNDRAYQTALDLVEAGIDIKAIIDVRREISGSQLQKLQSRGIPIMLGATVTSAQGSKNLRGVRFAELNGKANEIVGKESTIACDLLVVSSGWSPTIHLHAQSGGKPRYDAEKVCFVPGQPVQNEQSVGAANGQFVVDAAIQEAFVAGTTAARKAGCSIAVESAQDIASGFESQEYKIQKMWVVPNDANGSLKQFVDFQNDTTVKDIKLAIKEGYRSIEHLKRYTLLGFGTDQGKLGNINGLAILAKELNQSIEETGTTTFRPLYTPVTFGAIAGREIGSEFFDPVRKTAMHVWHVREGAEFENVGQWKRPWYYPRGEETMNEAVNRECLAVRNGVGIIDASTLGKIEIIGPDVVAFLNLMYTNAWNSLTTGSCRYGLMLGEDGMVMDDGVTAKLGDNHYYMTTTTGGAAHVLSWMERWRQTEWPWMKVYFTSVTDQWAVISIAGPKAREILQRVAPELDASNDSFPFMTFRESPVAGIGARIFRVSFSGELAYEINVPANSGLHVWGQVFEAGRGFDITPYGTEAMHVLRAEKGYIIVGQETDASMTPQDLGMDWICSKKKDFLGKRSLARSDSIRKDRKQMVGLMTEDPNIVLPEGAQLVEEPSTSYPVPMIGHVTSSYWSPTLKRSIALGFVVGGHSRMGGLIYAAPMSGKTVPVSICSPVFYDPQGERQNV